MKNITTILLSIFVLYSMQSNAQNRNFEERVKILKQRIENISFEERSRLKELIKDINYRLELEAISKDSAQVLKQKAAEESAQNIKIRIAEIEQQLRDLIQNKVDEAIFKEETSHRFRFAGLDIDYSENYHHKHRYYNDNRRTQSQTILAVGTSNLITDGNLNSLENSDFDFWKSHFFEIGSNSKTRMFKNSGLFYINYGLSLTYNVLSPKRNQFFVANNTATLLQTNLENLDKSKFKTVQLVVPLFFETDFSRSKLNEDRIYYRPNTGFKMGFGGFFGLNIKTKQILKYQMDDIKVKDIKKGDFNVNNFLYGLNGFVGYRDTSLFFRYHLNNLFKDNLIEQKNIEFGLRFEL